MPTEGEAPPVAADGGGDAAAPDAVVEDIAAAAPAEAAPADAVVEDIAEAAPADVAAPAGSDEPDDA